MPRKTAKFLAFFEKKVLWGLFSSACPFHLSVEIPLLLLLRLVKERKTAWAPSTCVTKTKKNLVPKKAFFSPCDFFFFARKQNTRGNNENRTNNGALFACALGYLKVGQGAPLRRYTRFRSRVVFF